MAAAEGIKAPSRSVFLGGLSPQVDDKTLYELGVQAGPVQSVNLQNDGTAKRSGFGFINYADLESAIYCVGLYRGLLHLFGIPVTVNFANKVVDPNHITDEHKALLDKVKRLCNSAADHGGGGGGGGAARRAYQAERYTPYGAPVSRRQGREQQQQWGAKDKHHDDDNADRAYGSSRYNSSRRIDGDDLDRNTSREYAGHGSAHGASTAQPERYTAPTPAEGWQSRAAAAAAAAAVQAEQQALLLRTPDYSTAQQHQQQYTYQPPAASASAGYSNTSWITAAQQQYAVPEPAVAAPAASIQYQSSLLQSLQLQAYQAPQPYQQPAAPAAAPAAPATYVWQQQHYQQPQQQALYQPPQQQQYQYPQQQQQQPVVLQVGYHQQQQPQVVVQQAPYQQQQQVQQPQVVYYYQQ